MRDAIELVRLMRRALASDLTGPYAKELRAAQRETVLERTVVLIWLSVFVMPMTICMYVYFAAGARLLTAAWIAFAAVTAVLALRGLIVRGVFERRYNLALVLLTGGVFGPTGTAVAEMTRTNGDFFFAFFLIYSVFTFVPVDLEWVLITSFAVLGTYTGFRFLRPEGFVFSSELAGNLIYLSQLTFISAVLNRVVAKLFFDEKKARIELAYANEGLRELDRDKTAFFSNISHEIRTPLTLILTPLAHMLSGEQGLPEPVKRRLHGIRANANRLLKMVNMLLDFAKVEAGHATITASIFDIDDLIRCSAELFEGAAERKELKIEVRAETGGAKIQSDLDKLEKILVNLIGNAIKFTPAGGTITVRSVLASGGVELSISDTGIGIPREHHKRVFARFSQVDGSHEGGVHGTGIGLALVEEYAKLLGGAVDLESEPGKGSTFTVWIPMHVQSIAAGPRVASERFVSSPDNTQEDRDAITADLSDDPMSVDAARAPREVVRPGVGRPRVLVVDDNPALLGLVSSILEDDNDLYLVRNAKDALARLRDGLVDLVLSDVMMPEISGLDLCRIIKSNPSTCHVPIVLLTARGATREKVEGLELGADDYIGKPFDPEELKVRVRSIFERRRLSQSLAVKSAELEKALAKLQQEEMKVIESEKLRTLGELAAGVFHELHNYLNMVHNGAAPLKEALEEMGRPATSEPPLMDVPELVELAGVILAAAASALEVTRDLKGFARYSEDRARATDVHAVIESSVRLFGRRDALHQIVLDLQTAPIMVECISSKLTLVFTNLIKNAFEAMKGKGTVTIVSRSTGTQATIAVTDEGPGVALDHRSKLFEPFQTTKKHGDGLGLGLSLARKVLQDLGGDLAYDAAYTAGARFVLTMPVAGSDRRQTAPLGEHVGAAR
jgi:signal transduction histidine kinase